MLFPTVYLYEAGSFMGCGCGFAYGTWSEEDPRNEHEARKRDVQLLMAYLMEARQKGSIQLFCTWWQELKDAYETVDFDLENISQEEFDFEEDIILKVKTP